jgi:ComF family protein
MPMSGGTRPRQPSIFSQLLRPLLALVFPSACALCGRELTGSLYGSLCSDCWRLLKPWTGAKCSRCGLPLAGSLDDPKPLCAACRRDEAYFDLARSFGVYASALRGAVLEVKFHQRERLGLRLGELLLEPWRTLESAAGLHGPVLILPVPLHYLRERERGYNQAGLLARGLVRALERNTGGSKAAFAGNCLVRRRPTPPQSGLSLHARQENVRGVFAVADPNRVHERDIILVDDVMTTGATASACAAALKRAGAGRVLVLTLARATPQFPHGALSLQPTTAVSG